MISKTTRYGSVDENPRIVAKTAEPNMTVRKTFSLPKRLAASFPKMEAGTANNVTVEAIVPTARKLVKSPELMPAWEKVRNATKTNQQQNNKQTRSID